MTLSQSLLWKAYSATVAAVSAIITKKAVDGAWHFVTGEEPPEPSDPHTPPQQAAAWVILMALGVGLSQVLVNRFAAHRWEKFSGEKMIFSPINVKL